MFAKLYETEQHGQILVVIDTNDDGSPSVTISVEPEGMGVCSLGPSWKDTDVGWSSAEKLFNDMTEDMAITFADEIFSQLSALNE